MATMNISLPDQMKAWVEAQSADGRYANSSDVIRELIRRDMAVSEKVAHMRRRVAEAEAGGRSDETMQDIAERALAEHERRKKRSA